MMRAVVVVIVQILVSLFVTASVMPLVLVTTPAAQTDPRLGLALMGGVLIVAFTLIALAWPRRLK
ncbi:MAG TPA: hypothetical protein VN700_18790 [Vicinamibacterales bacterium]|nr:hypothetical protein [Vicinamibacterales bacterium]